MLIGSAATTPNKFKFLLVLYGSIVNRLVRYTFGENSWQQKLLVDTYILYFEIQTYKYLGEREIEE